MSPASRPGDEVLAREIERSGIPLIEDRCFCTGYVHRRAAVSMCRHAADRPVILAAMVNEPDRVIGATVAALVDVYERSDCVPDTGAAP